MIEIDGSHGEGGGQIVRTSVTLAALTGQAVEIVNVRAGREKPGLQPQHLMAVKAAAELCGARLKGAEVRSMYVAFEPTHPVKAGDYRFDIGTAGATTLVAQTVLLPLTQADGDSTVSIRGGTHNPKAPTAEYLGAVYLAAMRAAGLQAHFHYERAGYYPAGGGEVLLQIPGNQQITPIELIHSNDEIIVDGLVVTSGLPPEVAARGRTHIEEFFKSKNISTKIATLDKPAIGAGASVTLVAKRGGLVSGFSSLGRRGTRMEEVVNESCEELYKWCVKSVTVDEHLADQLVTPLCLAKGPSSWTTWPVTEHLRTVAQVVQNFLPVTVQIDEQPDGIGLVKVSPRT